MFKHIVTVLLVFSSAGSAQQIAGLQNVQTASSGNSAVSITLESHNTTIARALEEIAKQAKMHVMLDESNAVLNTALNVKLKQVTLQDALTTVMYGTGAKAAIGPDGKTIVVRLIRQKGTPSQGVISGKVTDAKTGRGIFGANISLVNDNRGIVSDENGSYRIASVASGTYTVVVRLVGYAKQSRTVVVGDGATVTVDFKLDPSTNILNEVVVTGTVTSTELRAVPNAITIITAKQIEERGITRIDQLFRGEVPGLFALERGSSAVLDSVIIFSRGFTRVATSAASAGTKPIKTYIDGIEMADPVYLSQIDPKSIERLEILPGPQASTIYGANAINGVMQIFTKRGSTITPRMTIDISEGFTQNDFDNRLSVSHKFNGSISSTDGKISYNAGAFLGYQGAWTPGKQTQRINVYGGSRYSARAFSWNLSVRQGWTIDKQIGKNEQVESMLQTNGTWQVSSSPGRTIPTKNLLSGQNLGLSFSYTPVSWWSHQFNIGASASDTKGFRFTSWFANGTGAGSNDTTMDNTQNVYVLKSQSYSSTVRFPILSLVQASITYGGNHSRGGSSSMDWDLQPSGQITAGTISRPRATVSNKSGLYVQGQFGLWDALFLTYGVRADWAPTYGSKAKVRPGRYGMAYSREFGFVSAKFRGSYGTAIEPPGPDLVSGIQILPTTLGNLNALAVYVPTDSIFPLYSILPSPELGPEFQQGGEGGIELYFGNRGSLVITRFNQTVEGLIERISGVDSVRAVQPGPIVSPQVCPSSALRSDGYCYRIQDQYLNVGSLRNQGWALQGSINTGPFTTGATYSWTKSRVIGVTPRYRALVEDEKYTPGQAMSFAPEHTWAINVLYSTKSTSLSLNVNGLGQRIRPIPTSGDIGLLTDALMRLRAQESYRFTSLSDVRQSVAGYVTANLNVSHRLSRKLGITLQIDNLTNYYQNDVSSSYPTPGRTSNLGIRYNWQ